MYVVNIIEDNIDIFCVIKKKFVDEIYFYLIICVDLKLVYLYLLLLGFYFVFWDF